MGGTVNMEHTVSKPVITHKVLCEFSDEDHCTLGNSPLVLLLPCARCCSWCEGVAVDMLLSRLDRGHIYMFCPFQRQDLTQTFIRQLSLLRVEEQHTEFIHI